MQQFGEISEAELLQWQKFPDFIRNDRCFSSFQLEAKHQFDEKASLVGHKENAGSTGDPNHTCCTTLKHLLFAFVWIIAAWHLLTVKEKALRKFDIAINAQHPYHAVSSLEDSGNKVGISLVGSLSHGCNASDKHIELIVRDENNAYHGRHCFTVLESDSTDTISFNLVSSSTNLKIELRTNVAEIVSLQLFIDPHLLDAGTGALFAAIILILLNVLIVSEVVHRILAALFAAFTSIGLLAAMGDRPTMNDMIKWIDYETLLLIFSMMILVAILMDTGFFDFIAVFTFQVSGGKVWRLIYMLCMISALISMFLDNVTTILLMTPITVKLFECIGLNPVPILPFIILNVNIAGLTTLIGHPPNLLITGDSYISQRNITFLTFSMHMGVGVLIALIQSNIHLRLYNRNILGSLKDTKSLKELTEWKNCLNSARANAMLSKTVYLEGILLKRIEALEIEQISISDGKSFRMTLRTLKKTYPIKDVALLRKSLFVLAYVLSLFFIESIPSLQRLSLGWCAFTGAILLLLISDCHLDVIMQRIEWITLTFFGAMFITMECLARLGLITWIGDQTERLILMVDEDWRLALAIFIILWVSALTSSVVDSIPVTAMMVKIVVSLAQNKTLNLPVEPMVYALAYGPTLGGNGSLYGASSNIVCAGVAEKLGYKITFFQYFKIGFPVMLGNVMLVTAYLFIAHVIFEWH